MPRTTPAAHAPAGPAAARPAPAGTAHPAPRPRRPRDAAPAPLGSLTRADRSEPEPCPECGGTRLTTLAMTLTDGTAVRFTSCRRCEHRRWEAGDGELSIGAVLERTRRTP